MSTTTRTPGQPKHAKHAKADDHVGLATEARRQRKSWTRFRNLVRHSVSLSWHADRRLFLSTTVLQLSGALVLGAQVLAIRAVLEAILGVTDGDASATTVLLPVGVLALISGFVALSSAIQTNHQRLLGELVARNTWQRMLDVAGSVNLRTFEMPNFYDRLQRVQTNAMMRPFQLTRGLVGLLGAMGGVVALSIAVISLEPLLLPLLLLAGVPMLITTRRESTLEFAFTVAQTPRFRLRHYLGQLQTGRDEAKEMRAFGLAGVLRERFDRLYTDYTDDLRVHVRRRTRLAVIGNLAAAAFLAMALFTLVWMIDVGRVGLAEAGAAIVAIRLLATQVTTVFKSAQQIFESGLFLDDLNDFVAIGQRAHDHDDDGQPAPDGFTDIAVENLGFTYPGSTTPALSDVSMTLGSGEIVALVGENGSGKTTLAKLLATLYDPDEGRVCWDGVDVRSYRRPELRRSIAVIFQDFVRYQLSVRDNIGLGRAERIDDDAVAAAATRAGVNDIIDGLPYGYDTVLSRMFGDGHDLSGGQWQRMALARAHFRDAPFVILDEPSAALDPRAEHRLFSSLRDVLDGRTVLFISHRFSSVRSADRIVVLHEGQVAEQGSHDELMTRDGRYAELFRLQAAAYLDND